MKIATAQLGFPIFRFETVVHHHTPRKPTVFEDMLLRLHERLAGYPTYNSIPLHRIFEDILCVADPDGLVLPSLERLITQGIFRCRAALQSLREVTLQDLQRTPLADQMLRDGMLPATAVEDTVAHTYDPVGGRFLNGNASRLLRREKPPVAISEEPFRGAYPADLIAATVPKAGHHWWHESSRIDRVECRNTLTLWSMAQATLQLSDQGELSLELPDRERTAYVVGMDERTRAEQVFLTILRGRPDRPAWEELLPPLELPIVLPTARDLLPVPEPMLQAKGLAHVAKGCQAERLSVMTFTGYTLGELDELGLPGAAELIACSDIVVDGPYLQRLQDASRNWVGSSNRRFHFLTCRYQAGIEFDPAYRHAVEVRLGQGTALHMNGDPAAIGILLSEPTG